ncbi:hypothetical protein D9M68_406320 [compost metagenome]
MTTEQGADGVLENLHVRLLGDEAGAAGLQAKAGVVFVALAGVDQHRHGIAFVAQLAGDLQAAQARQGEVEDEQRGGLALAVQQGVTSVVEFDDYPVAVFLQAMAQRLADQRVFVGDDDVGHLPASLVGIPIPA